MTTARYVVLNLKLRVKQVNLYLKIHNLNTYATTGLIRPSGFLSSLT